MKRTSVAQEKPRHSSVKADGTKMKDMQKAYGVSSKAKAPTPSTTKKSVVKGSSSTIVTAGAAGDTSSTRSRTSITNNSQRARRTSSESKSDNKNMASTRRSQGGTAETATNPSKHSSSSKILAASKANYAEKYGTGGGSVRQHSLSTDPKNKAGGAATTKKNTTAGATATGSSKRISNGGGGGSTSTKSPYQVKSPQKQTSVKASSSVSSLLTTQIPPNALYESEVGSELSVDQDDYGEDDFEEDYESDFEEAMSSEEDAEAAVEDTEPAKNENDSIIGNAEEDPIDDIQVVEDEDYDKSSSLRDFEKLEKMVEGQVVQQNGLEEQPRKLSGRSRIDEGETDSKAAKEPEVVVPNTQIEESSEEEEEEDEEEDYYSSAVPSTPVGKRQNAFPTTTGFSINTAAPPMERERRSASAAMKSAGRREVSEVAVIKTNFQEPTGESGNAKGKRVNRGKIIQGMIKLDRVQVDIFHHAPYQYERFMAVFSGNDRLQASVQTDQDKSEESSQTEPIDQTAKWTQKPPTWSTTSSSCDIRIVRQEALGVGSDEISEDLSPDYQKIHKQFDFLKNWEQLSNFILRGSRKMLYILEAEERIKLPASSGNKGSLETIKMNRGLPVLSKLSMHTLASDGEFVGCANGTKENGAAKPQEKVINGNKKHTSKNLVTVWSLKEPSMPLYFLRVWGHLSALKLHMIGRMVVSGNKDGSLNLWNLDESMCYHSQYQDQVIRTPSVNTSCMMPTHILPIVGIEMFSESKNTFSLVSMDREGLLITWSCLRSHDTLLGESTFSQHSSAWSTIHMSVRYQIKLGDITRDHLQITCFSSFWDVDATTTGFYFGTFNGYVAKGKVVVEGASLATTTIEKYQERGDTNPKITCMDISKTLNILVMGCEDGRCRLFELSRKKMVLSLGGKQEPLRVRWSGRRASVLYVALRDSLLIWDLLSSDMNPWKTIHLNDIQDFVLYSPPHKEYLVIITGNDLIISTPAEEVKPLSNREFSRIQSYFSVLC